MNIEQYVDKLPQLDRIEFRQKLDNCEMSVSIKEAVWSTLIINFILVATGHVEIAIKLLNLLLFVAGIEFCLMLLGILITDNRKKKLYETYFKLEVKKKK